MKLYVAIFLAGLGFTSTAQDQVQPVPAPLTGQQQIQQQQQVQQSEVPATAQVEQTQPSQPPQPSHVVLRVVGSQVRNQSGERLGLIEQVLVSRASGGLEYAVVSPHYPTNSARQVPVPWGTLSHAWDQSRAGGPPGANQVFILNVDARRLAMAPALDWTRPAVMGQTLANAGTFFGQPVGATGPTAGTVSGVGTATTPVIEATTTSPIGGTVVTQPDNQLTVPGQRSTVQPGVDNRLPPPEQRVPHPNNNNTITPGAGTPATGSSGTTVPATGGGTRSSGGGSSGGGATGGSGSGGAGAAGR